MILQIVGFFNVFRRYILLVYLIKIHVFCTDLLRVRIPGLTETMKKSFFVFIALILILSGCSNPDDNLTELSFSCDLENSRFSNFIASNGLSLTGARYKSTLHSRSGKYSIMLSDGRDKGLDVELNNVSIGDKIHAEVWRLKKENQNGYLALFIGEFFQFYSSTASRTEGDWELLEISVVVSKEFPGEGMGVFVQNMDDQPA